MLKGNAYFGRDAEADERSEIINHSPRYFSRRERQDFTGMVVLAAPARCFEGTTSL